jgi:hypothetical protein
MPSTFIDLTNTLLRRLNEVEIAEADFGSTRGVQALAKDAIRSSIAKINSAEFEWPFNAAQHSQTLTVGVEEYSWPTFFKTAEHNSFQLVGDPALGTTNKPLKFISRDVWYQKYRHLDADAGASGRGKPEFVFPSHGNGYGLTPSPDNTYTITFQYFLTHSALQAAGDQTRVPTIYDHILIDGALYYLYMFRDNTEQANVAMSQFLQGIKDMQSVLINKYESIRDTRVSF